MLAPLATRLFALIVLPGSVWFGPAPQPQHLTDATLRNVVHVKAGPSTGTAFLMRYGKERYLVTARHVVAPHLDEVGIPVRFLVGGKRGRPIEKTSLFRVSERADVAVFRYEEDKAHPYFAKDAGLRPTDDLHLASQVFLIGYPASLRQTYGSSQLRVVGGWVAGLRKYVPGSTVEYADIDMPGVEHGHSGGPILLLQDRVVAVAVQRRQGSISRSIAATYAVPIKYVTALLDGVPVQEDVSALNEALRGTTLVCGLSLQGKSDYDVWVQRIHRESGEPVWGELGISVASSSSPETVFRTVPSASGSTLVVHTIEQPDGSDTDVMVQRISRYGELLFEGGAYSRTVFGTDQHEDGPDAVQDGAGGAIVVATRHQADGNTDVVAQRVSAQGACLWPAAGVSVASAKAAEEKPHLIPDGSGGAIVVFERRLPEGDVDIVAQRVEADGRLAWHEGKRSAEIAFGDADETRPHVVSDGDGGAIVVFESEIEGGRRVVCGQRISHHGALLWNDGKPLPLCPLATPGGPRSVRVIADGFGGVFVAMEVWTSLDRPGDVDIAVQRVSACGALQWMRPGTDGAMVPTLAASSPFGEREPVLVSDGEGGLVVAFVSGSENGDLDVWAQRIASDGRLLWNEGRRSAEVSMTFLTEHTVRILERHGDRVMLVFEVERESGRRSVACQALDLKRGTPLFGGGKVPLLVVDPRDREIGFHLCRAKR